MTTLRPYQSEAIAAVHAYWTRGGGNPLVDLATGTGKSIVLAQIARDVVEQYDARVIVLTHVKELVEQDLRATLRLWPQCPAGVNSAGLGRRDRRSQVLFASIQSVFKLGPEQIGARHLVIVDEAHLIPRAGEGMYLKFLARMREALPDMRVLGLTATPYRLDSGRLDRGDGRLFDEIVYSYGIGDGVRDGFLSPLVSRDGEDGQIDTRAVAKRGGEFVAGALESAANKSDLVAAACTEIIARGQSRRGWIIFGAGVAHADAVADCLRSRGVAAACVTGETPAADRDRMIREFKAGQLRALTSVGVLTTGFDAPHVDLIALMRPTLSTGLYVQMLGRGTRLASEKDNCLVLDFSGNVRRHGPVDAIEVRGARSAGPVVAVDAEPRVMAKACPSCGNLQALAARECRDCGFEFPREDAHDAKADTRAAVMVREVEAQWLDVIAVVARPWQSAAGRWTIRVDYLSGNTRYPEWVSLGAPGYPGERAKVWWRAMVGGEAPPDVDAVKGISIRVDCKAIRVKRDGKYWRVVDRRQADGTTVDERLRVTRPPVEQEKAA